MEGTVEEIIDINTEPCSAAGNVLLRAERLRKAFGGQVVLKDISLELRRGEVVLLRGNNGSGKTTLLNILTGNITPDRGAIQFFINARPEQFYFPKPWWQSLNPFSQFSPERLALEGVGRSWQDIRLFATQILRNNIAVAGRNQLGENPARLFQPSSGISRGERDLISSSDDLLARIGLAGREYSSADKISLGQSKRVAIARALQAGAKILFLDEPLEGLDADGISEILSLLKDLVQQHQVTLVIVEHVFNIPSILDLVTTVWTLADGHITIKTSEEVRAELAYTAEEDINYWIKRIIKLNGTLEQQNLPGGAKLSIFSPPETDSSEILLEVKDLVAYRGHRLVIGAKDGDGRIQGISFLLRRGQLAVLQAPNGWGKTTLLSAMAGLSPIYRGEVWLKEQSISGLPPWERTRLGLSLFQSQNNTFSSLSVSEVLRLSQVMDVSTDIESLSARRGSDLSGGEKRKVALACALKPGSFDVGLLDEPFSALDTRAINYISDLLSEHLRKAALLIAMPSSVHQPMATMPTPLASEFRS